MTEQDGLTVGRTATLVGVSVKTLHHWDAVALVRPSGRTRSGYRVYAAEDVARLHRVLVYRELGFPLSEIGRLLDDPSVDAHTHLTTAAARAAGPDRAVGEHGVLGRPDGGGYPRRNAADG